MRRRKIDKRVIDLLKALYKNNLVQLKLCGQPPHTLELFRYHGDLVYTPVENEEFLCVGKVKEKRGLIHRSVPARENAGNRIRVVRYRSIRSLRDDDDVVT